MPGRLAISARPRGGDWLDNEIAEWRRAGIDVVTSLLTSEEAEELHLTAEGQFCQMHSMVFLPFPIADRSVPALQSEAVSLIRRLKGELEAGRNIAIHCRQSIGRSGLIAAAILIFAGINPNDAIRCLSEARGLAVPETTEQRAWVAALLQSSASPNTLPLDREPDKKS